MKSSSTKSSKKTQSEEKEGLGTKESSSKNSPSSSSKNRDIDHQSLKKKSISSSGKDNKLGETIAKIKSEPQVDANNNIDKTSTSSENIDKRLMELKIKEEKWNEIEKKIEENLKARNNIITLNVGGQVFSTSKSNLLRFKDSYFYGLVARGWKPDSNGTYFIDRSPKLFSIIFDYLRDGDLTRDEIENLSLADRKMLQKELDYYLLPNIQDIIPILRWDGVRLHNSCTISPNGRRVTKTINTGNWNAVIANIPNISFFVKCSGSSNIMVGYITLNSFTNNGPNHAANGYYLYLNSGYLTGQQRESYCNPIAVGSVIEVRLQNFTFGRKISFSIDSVDKGTAYYIRSSTDIYPSVEMYSLNDTAEFVND